MTVQMLDPVCDMTVDLDEAREAGLTMELGDREYAFCDALATLDYPGVMRDWKAKEKRRQAKREERANLYPIHGGSLRSQAPRPLSKKVQSKLRKRRAR